MKLDRTVYTLDGESITVAEIAAWAYLSDLGAPLHARLARKCASLARAEEREDELDDDAVQQAANAWRAKNGLTTADATRTRFAEIGVTFDDLGAYIERTLWRERRGEEDTGATEPNELFAEELFFEGHLDELGRVSATRAVVPAGEADLDDARAEILRSRGWKDIAAAVAARAACGVTEEQARRAIDREALWSCQRTALVTDAAVERAIGERREDLRRIVVSAVEAWSPDCAKELFLCVRDDGKTLEAAASLAGLEVREEEWRTRELGASLLGARILGALAGQALLPEPGAPLVVRQVKRRVEAEPRDPAVRAHVSEQLIEERLAAEVARRVAWADGP